jgi:hypothetical protein
MFPLNHHAICVLSAQEFSEIAYGAVGEQFCFPTVAIEWKSGSGSGYFTENQLLGSLYCIYESHHIAKWRFSENPLQLALGMLAEKSSWKRIASLTFLLIVCRTMFVHCTFMISTCSMFMDDLLLSQLAYLDENISGTSIQSSYETTSNARYHIRQPLQKGKRRINEIRLMVSRHKNGRQWTEVGRRNNSRSSPCF